MIFTERLQHLFKPFKGTVFEPRFLPANFRRFPGISAVFPGHFRARCFQLWTGFTPHVLIPHKKPSKTTHVYDMMVARFRGGGGN